MGLLVLWALVELIILEGVVVGQIMLVLVREVLAL
jgi:hypothetical protein